jgi:hypothetical protein
MPGLLRGVARTAVVAGTATAVSNRVSRRQVNRWGARGELPGQQAYAQQPDPYQQQSQQYAPPPPAEPAEDPVQQLRELAKLRDDGILTEEEFAAEKRKILG